MKCRAFAKALHYKEEEFHRGPNTQILESLIRSVAPLAEMGGGGWGGVGVGECRVLVRIEQRFNLSFIIFFVLLCGYFSVEQCFILSFIIIIFYFTVIFF